MHPTMKNDPARAGAKKDKSHFLLLLLHHLGRPTSMNAAEKIHAHLHKLLRNFATEGRLPAQPVNILPLAVQSKSRGMEEVSPEKTSNRSARKIEERASRSCRVESSGHPGGAALLQRTEDQIQTQFRSRASRRLWRTRCRTDVKRKAILERFRSCPPPIPVSSIVFDSTALS